MIKIIADIGINHNGNLSGAKELAYIAKEAGCNYVKLQKRTIDKCYLPEWLERECRSPWGTTIRDKVYGRELEWEEIDEFADYCNSIDLKWAMSCFDIISLETYLSRYKDIPFIKVPSGVIMSDIYMHRLKQYKKLIILSTGLATEERLEFILKLFESFEIEYILNHCVSLYPPKDNEFNMQYLHRLQDYQNKYPYCVGIGYSSHEIGIVSSLLSVCFGVDWIEQHVTLDKTAYGADQKFSLEPNMIRTWVTQIRSAEQMLSGHAIKEFTGKEKKPVILPEELYNNG